jgi:hypothetical protein
MAMSPLSLRQIMVAGFLCSLVGCANEAEPQTAADADDPCAKEEVQYAGRTAGSAAKTGGETAAEGVKTFGKSVGGLFTGGSEGAEKEWKEGSDKTKETAKSDAKDTKATAKDKPCQ